MYPGPADDSEDLVERLGRLVSSADEAGRAQVDRGKALVLALTDQLAAGQTETLYGLQTAARSIKERSQELQRLADQLPDEVADRIRELVEELADDAGAQVRDALDAASTRLGIVVEGVHRELTQQQETYLAVLRESAEATGSQLSDELEHAATVVVESAARAKASQTAVRAAAVAAVETLETTAATVTEQLAEMREQMAATAEAFAADAEGVIQSMTAVGESFINRLFEVLDERDERDRVSEERMTARIEGLARAMDVQVSRLEERDLAERSTTVADLHAVLERILAEPRGKLRELRSASKPGAVAPRQPAPQPAAPLRDEPVYESYVAADQDDPAYGEDDAYEPPPPRKPAKKAPGKKAPAKTAAAKKPAAKRAPAKKTTRS